MSPDIGEKGKKEAKGAIQPFGGLEKGHYSLTYPQETDSVVKVLLLLFSKDFVQRFLNFYERSGPAIGAKTLLVFPAKSQQEFPGGRFVPNQVFVGF